MADGTGVVSDRTLALVPWGLLLEDFLEPNGLALEDFCGEFTGSWMFGYADALRRAGVTTVIVCVSRSVPRVTRVIHTATGTPISLVPAPSVYRLLRATMRHPYARTGGQVFALPRPVRIPLSPLLFAAKEASPYLATPARALVRELRRRRCDAVLCQEYEFPRFDVCVALRRFHRLPVYGVFQGGDYQRWRVERLLRPRTIPKAAGLVVASSREVARLRARYAPPPIASVPNPVDTERWRPRDRDEARVSLGIPEGARVAAWHGRIDIWKKGLDTLVEAWSAVSQRLPDARLVLIGSGAENEELRRRIAAAAPANVGWVNRYVHDPVELSRLLSAADVYLFPSRHEGFPLAPIEAMACGLPVVASDVSGIRDVLAAGDDSGGVIVPADDAAALAAAIMRLFDDPAAASLLGTRARETAERYGAEHVGRELRAFFFPSETTGAGATAQ